MSKKKTGNGGMSFERVVGERFYVGNLLITVHKIHPRRKWIVLCLGEGDYETIGIGDELEVISSAWLAISFPRGGRRRVRINVKAPKSIDIDREEVRLRKLADNERSAA